MPNTVIPDLALASFHTVTMKLASPNWWDAVPGKPGWYAIETDAPLSIIAQVPSCQEGKHYRLAERFSNSQFLISNGAAIVPSHGRAFFVVYSGEHHNLKSRAREHTHGNKGTGCMCLSQYESLREFGWKFRYRTCEEHLPGSSGNKMLRTYLEQKWRGEHGWPVLCAR